MTALNFEPMASPAVTPASAQAQRPPCSAYRAASVTVATTKNVRSGSTDEKWLNWMGSTAKAYAPAARRPTAEEVEKNPAAFAGAALSSAGHALS